MKLENDFEKGIVTGLIILFFIIAFNYYPISWRLILPFVGGIIVMKNIWKKWNKWNVPHIFYEKLSNLWFSRWIQNQN